MSEEEKEEIIAEQTDFSEELNISINAQRIGYWSYEIEIQ
jgi:hypothetical protein